MNPLLRALLMAGLFCCSFDVSAALAQQGQTSQTPISEAQFAANTLAQLQARSIGEGVEYCGFLGRDATGAFAATPAQRGTSAGCTLPNFPAGLRVTASYHTHANFDPSYNSEVPSALDMETDRANRTNGYVATPGGRLWFIDTTRAMTYQLCAQPCLPRDPAHREPAALVQSQYTYDELRALQ